MLTLLPCLQTNNHCLNCPLRCYMKYCPDDVYQLMLCCWEQERSERPTFDRLCEGLEIMTQGLAKDHQLYHIQPSCSITITGNPSPNPNQLISRCPLPLSHPLLPTNSINHIQSTNSCSPLQWLGTQISSISTSYSTLRTASTYRRMIWKVWV